MLYIIGIGLGNINDITLTGHEKLQTCETIFIDSYTSMQNANTYDDLINRYKNAKVVQADRELVESLSDNILNESLVSNCAFLVIGDPFCATTHADLYLRAKERNIETMIINNASIITSIGITGLNLYIFGQIVSIPYFEKNWKPRSFIDKIGQNLSLQLHTLVLLDIKVKEQTVENIMKKNQIYEMARYMSINEAIKQIFEVEQCILTKDHKCIGVARIGSDNQLIKSGTLGELEKCDFGAPLHSLIITNNNLNIIEKKFFELYKI